MRASSMSSLAGEFVKIRFRLEIGDLVDSDIMQLYPIPFAKEMCESVTQNMEEDTNSTAGSKGSARKHRRLITSRRRHHSRRQHRRWDSRQWEHR